MDTSCKLWLYDIIMVNRLAMIKNYPLLTIFTPAYNRAHTISRTYKSLCRQTCKDFEWLIIDDGSSDNTRELVEGWIAEDIIPIRYIYQKNQGMHGAHNTAYKNINTELNTCIDSDDWMPDDAVEKIVSFWKKYGSKDVAGFMGLDATEDGRIIGKKFSDSVHHVHEMDYYERNGGNGDKKFVYRTDIILKYPPYPVFEGEHYVGLDVLYDMIDKDYELMVTNDILCIVEYQTDGSTNNMWRQYWNNPKGFSFYRKMKMKLTNSFRRKLKENIHYVSHSIRSCNINFIEESPMPIFTLFSIIPGFFLYLYTWSKNRNKK